MAERSRHVYWAHALETLLREIESNGYAVLPVEEDEIRVYGLDDTEYVNLRIVAGHAIWTVIET